MIVVLDYISRSSVWVCFCRATLEEDLLVFLLGLHIGLVFGCSFVDLFFPRPLERIGHKGITMECGLAVLLFL